MSFEVIDSLFTIKADGIMTVAMAAVILLIGFFIKSKVKFLEKYCICSEPMSLTQDEQDSNRSLGR